MQFLILEPLGEYWNRTSPPSPGRMTCAQAHGSTTATRYKAHSIRRPATIAVYCGANIIRVISQFLPLPGSSVAYVCHGSTLLGLISLAFGTQLILSCTCLVNHIGPKHIYIHVLPSLLTYSSMQSGWTPLHVAAVWGREAACPLLIEAGAEVGARASVRPTLTRTS